MQLIISNRMRELFLDDDDADRYKHPLYDTGRKITGDPSRFCQTQRKLDQTCDDNRSQKGFIAEIRDRHEDDRDQSRRRPAHTYI